jgi:choline dehydrogenase-like flavoprotein
VVVDLSESAAPSHFQADVCIVGGGTIGCYMASRLAALGLNVVVAEAGSETVVDGASLGLSPTMTRLRYGGAFEGRTFGLGGTSALWGGVLIPYGELDSLAADPESARTWSRIESLVRGNALLVRSHLGVTTPPDYDDAPSSMLRGARSAVDAVGLQVRYSEMLPFPLRNFARLLTPAGGFKGTLTVVLNAIATGWSLATAPSGARVEVLRVVGPTGRTGTFAAKQYVLAAGAIESTRILMEMDRATEGKVLLGRSDLGRFLSDHISAPVASFPGSAGSHAIGLLAPSFDGRVLRALRFIDPDILRGSGTRHFLHVAFSNDNAGFLLAKKVLFAIQRRSMPSATAREIASGMGGLAALAFDRYVRKRLFIAKGTPVHLQLDVEQSPRRQNGIRFRDERDRHGRFEIAIDWDIDEMDMARVVDVCNLMLEKWSRLGGEWPAAHRGGPALMEGKLHDTFHPVGTCRMGTGASAVVDLDMRARGVTNLMVAGTSVFPSAGCANPTFSALCLSESIVKHLEDKRNSGGLA